MLVKGIVIPRGTSTRADVPDPLSGFPLAGEVLLHKGHLMALSLGGPDVSENTVPQYAGFRSSGVWRRMERAIELDSSPRTIDAGVTKLAPAPYRRHQACPERPSSLGALAASALSLVLLAIRC